MRKSEILLDAIGKIDDELIATAGKVKDKSRIKIWLRCGALAACLALVVGICSVAGWFAPNESLPELPMLTISETSGAMGFEGYMAYDVSELINANPWYEDAKLSTLPVFRNKLSYDNNMIVHGQSFEDMKALLLDTAERLGMDTDKLVITDDTPSADMQAAITEKFAIVGEEVPDGYFDPTSLIAEQDGIRIEVVPAMNAIITFDPARAFPDGLGFHYHSPYKDVEATAEYIKEEYKELLNMNSPITDINGGDYNIYGEQSFNLCFYDNSKDLTQRIINYNFHYTSFFCNDSEELFHVCVHNCDLSDKVGDYPIITTEEAEKLLLNGNFVTTVPYDFPGGEYVKNVELLYRVDARYEYYIPYYRFYIELPEAERDGGMKTYGAYYVPAVREEYIENMPLWNGSFN